MTGIASYLESETLQGIADGLSRAADVCVALTDAAGNVLAEAAPDNSIISRIGRHPWSQGRVSTTHPPDFTADSQTAPLTRHPAPGGFTLIATPIIGPDGPAGAIVASQPPAAPLSTHQLRELAGLTDIPSMQTEEIAGEASARLGPSVPALDEFLLLVAQLLGQVCRKEADLQERIDDLGAIYSVAGLVSSSSDLQQILDTAAEQIRRVMRVRASSIRLIDPETGELRISAVSRLSDTYLNKGPIKLERNPIDQAAIQGNVIYVRDMATDPRTLYPAEARTEGIVSSLVAGMLFAGRPIGVIRVYSDHVQRFSSFDGSLLRTMASQLAAAIHSARLYAEARDAERYAAQLAHAGDVQRRMIPSSPPRSDRVELACVYHPSLALGGDFCDFIELPHGHIGVAIADVVGKGVAAALVMASVRSALRAHAGSIVDIDEIMRRVNRGLHRDSLVSEFATLFYGVISADEPVLTYCNAGHDPPLLVRDGELTALETSGMAIGIDPRQDYARHRLGLVPGDILVLFTDGLLDATAYSGDLFGRRRLGESILRHKDQPADRMARNVMMDIQRFIGLAPQSDDVTLVVARFRGPG